MFVSLDGIDPLKNQIMFFSLESLAFPNVHLHCLVALPCCLRMYGICSCTVAL